MSITRIDSNPRMSQLVIHNNIAYLSGQVDETSVIGRSALEQTSNILKQIDDYLRLQMPVWKFKYPGVEGLKVAVMGCIVNGPGESKHADIGISLPGTGESPVAPVFIDGEKAMTLRGENIIENFQEVVENYVHKRFGFSAAH